VTDIASGATSDCVPQLRNVARRSVHESRNALNGLVVNLEVVRSRLARSGDYDDLLAFAEHAAAQGETSVQITEGIGALLSLILGSVDGSGVLRCSASASPGTLQFKLEAGVAERVVPALVLLGKTAGFTIETSGAETVILSFPEQSSTEHKPHE
jgi:hypothetical protein